MTSRTPLEVLEHHLAAFGPAPDALERVLSDYADDAVLMTVKQVWRGRAEIRTFYEAFLARVPDVAWRAYEVTRTNVAGEVAMVTWRALPFVPFATDSLVVRDGRIVYQTMASVWG